MQCKERLEAYLTEHQVDFQEQRHERAFSAQRIAESEHVSSKKVAKVVVLFVDAQPGCFVLPAAYHVDLEKVRAILGAKDVSLAREDELVQVFPDCEPGSMPPFGNLYGIPVYVDNSLAAEDVIVFAIGTYTDTMSLKYADFERLVQPRVLPFASAQPAF